MGVSLTTKTRPVSRRTFLVGFLMALGLSVALHLFLYKKAEGWKVHGFSPESYDQIVPRTFRMERVEIDPKTLEEPTKKEEPNPKDRPVTIEKEIPDAASMPNRGDGMIPKPAPISMADSPAEKSQITGAEMILPKDDGKSTAATMEIPETAESSFSLPEAAGNGGSTPDAPAFSSLDDLLAGKEAVTAGTAPILMPTDLLFEYDSATLKPDAEESLRKLGTLIRRNGEARFRIEGHTDSFGADEYNMALSLRRAAAVKEWLQRVMGIDPTQISTIGLGKSHLLVPGDKSVAEQRLNRRVEIVISTP